MKTSAKETIVTQRMDAARPHSHSVDALVDVDGVLSGHHFVDG